MKSFIEYKNFMPLFDDDGKVNIDEKINILVKNSLGKVTEVELINGDLLSETEIK